MPFLVIPLGTSNQQPPDGKAFHLAAVIYHREHPGDLYGDALIIECEYQPDSETTEHPWAP